MYKRIIKHYRRNLTIKRLGFWFVDVPRTSSSSLRGELGRRFGPVYGKTNIDDDRLASQNQLVPDHIPASRMMAMTGRSTWNKIFTFSVVRNPWDRILSLYFYRKRNVERGLPADWDFAEFVHRLAYADASTPEFQYHGFRFGASDFLTDAEGRLIVDKIVKFENRASGLSEIGQRIGLPELGQVHIQSAKPSGTHYSTFYTPETRDIIARRYAKDIELFGYEFEEMPE